VRLENISGAITCSIYKWPNVEERKPKIHEFGRKMIMEFSR